MEHRKEAEAVYFAQEDSHIVMSEKVQALAGSIYQEFERMIGKYDEEVVKDLMPLVVNVLECLDLSYTENQEHEVEVELLREDNEQLVTQYEREKALRKTSEQKLLELEDHSEETNKDLTSKIESLEAILRMLELRSRNGADHVSRLEEKENEMKKEYSKLHDRYTELFKTHMDYMERTKILMGTDRLENFGISGMNRKLNNLMTRSAGPMSYGFESLANNSSMMKSYTSPDGSSGSIPYQSGNMRPPNIQEEMSMDDVSEALPDSEVPNGTDDDFDELSESSIQQLQPAKSKTKKEERTSNTHGTDRGRSNILYQECIFQDPELAEESRSWVHPGEYASSGMGKEVENLILENSELLATKNALNIVKDDLIAKVDELTSEHEILREEITSINALKARMKLRNTELEDEIKKIKEEYEKKSQNKSDDEDDVPLAQRKRFTRVEMARVLMERNQYKERYMELQDAVRWTEMLRAAKQDPSLEKRNNRGIFNFFSNLFSKGASPAGPITTDRLVSTGGMVPHVSPTRNPTTMNQPGSDTFRPNRTSELSADKLQLRRLGEPQQRRDTATYNKIKAHVRKDDGRMQIFCASGVNLCPPATGDRPSYLSHVWVCTATHSTSRVSIIDANRPAEILLSFEVCSSHLLCISSVPGISSAVAAAMVDGVVPDGINLDYKTVIAETDSKSRPEEVGGNSDSPEDAEGASLAVEATAENLSAENQDELNSELEPRSTSQFATMWLGAQNGYLYIYSAVSQRNVCLHKVKLPDSILAISHHRGRTFVSMANGTVAIFKRGTDESWDVSGYHLVDWGQPHHSIRCLSVVHEEIWCGFRNKIYAIDVLTLQPKKTFEAHPRKESQVRQTAWCGDGVWISIRLDSTLRLYHARTYEHLQDVDIEPYVSKMLGTGKLGFSYARITALLIASQRLWIGTGNGVIISVPLSETSFTRTNPFSSQKTPGTVIRFTGDDNSRNIPYCSMPQAQLSFHGHRDAVKFFVAVPGGGNTSVDPVPDGEVDLAIRTLSDSMLVISGGDGYVDFRDGDDSSMNLKSMSDPNQPGDKPHIIIWQIPSLTPSPQPQQQEPTK
ncbi:JNK-interacting protein 3 [Folsomia candida]|uniref:JNK-interacting protein 3 n=1 Tax=Folsomia candida TaxID=158441 RepID=A0A226E777_FOLCA|nr:JNK-interacting protein 3 [Folsomia candida]